MKMEIGGEAKVESCVRCTISRGGGVVGASGFQGGGGGPMPPRPHLNATLHHHISS